MLLLWGVCVLYNASPVIHTMHESPAARGCDNGGVCYGIIG